jgi:methyl halide transferase
MTMGLPDLDKTYWEGRYQDGATGWDIGNTSTPLQEYFDQLSNKSTKILIPGCGRAWEGEYLHNAGFENVFLIDLAPSAIEAFLRRVPTFPEDHLILGDFFQLRMNFDLIVEQTFFCAINPALRRQYVTQTWNLLNENGKLVGLLFDEDFGNDHPPFGGSKKEYLQYFEPWFRVKYFDIAYNSIKPRQNKEIFMNLVKR